MADVPKLVTNWRRVAWTVIASIRENAARVAPKIQRDLYPERPDDDDVQTAYLARASSIVRKLRVLEDRANVLLAERGDNAALAHQLDDAVLAVRDRVIRIRSFAEGAFSPEILAQLGLTSETPRDPDALVTYATHASSQLRTVALPATRADELGASFDAGRSAALIDEVVAPLEAAIEASRQDRRQDEAAAMARNVAEEDLQHAYAAAADVFAADAIAAGIPEIADRVRPTARRREGLPEETDVDDGTGEDGGGGGDPDPTLVTGGPTAGT